MLKHFETIHFIGVGGIGMSGLARILLSRGKQVSGSDLKGNGLVEQLRHQGARIYTGHAADNVPAGTEYVVISTAISPDNPEYQEAQRRHIPIIHRADVLGYLLETSRSLSVTGTHGKTTTSALLAMILVESQLDPTIIIGGEVPQLGTNAAAGKGEFVVAEVDESDQSLRRLSTEVAIISNLEVDHLDHYKGMEEIIEAVAEFIGNQPAHGKTIVNSDDAGNQQLLQALPAAQRKRCVTFSLHDMQADYRAQILTLGSSGSRFQLYYHNQLLGEFELGIPGQHNVYNALSTLACAHALGLDLAPAHRALAQYRGVKRRFQLIGQIGDVSVIDDYAHHPSEIEATLKTARLQHRPITAIFQPHRYSRTQALLQDFAAAFTLADRIIFTDIYAASENPNHFQVNIQDLVNQTQAHNPDKEVLYFADFQAIGQYIISQNLTNDMIMTIGAGNITDLAPQIVGKLQQRALLQSDPLALTSKDRKIVYAPVLRSHQERKVV
jgi:UDP-N-acetylmuramate--alanine ligase